MRKQIKKWLPEEEVEKQEVSHIMVDEHNGVTYDALAEQIAYRELISVSDIENIEVHGLHYTYNDNIMCGETSEYFSNIEDYKRSIA